MVCAPPISAHAFAIASTMRSTAARHVSAPASSSAAGSVNVLPRRVRAGSIGRALNAANEVDLSDVFAVAASRFERRGAPRPSDRRASCMLCRAFAMGEAFPSALGSDALVPDIVLANAFSAFLRGVEDDEAEMAEVDGVTPTEGTRGGGGRSIELRIE